MTGIAADQQAGEEREPKREQQHRKIDANFMDARQAGGRHRHQKAQRAVGQCQADQAARNPKHDALEEQLRRDSSPARAQRGANRQLLPASFDAHQQQVGDVRAGHQQNQDDRAHQHPQHVAHIPDHVLLQRPEVRRNPRFFKEADAESLGRRESFAGPQEAGAPCPRWPAPS